MGIDEAGAHLVVAVCYINFSSLGYAQVVLLTYGGLCLLEHS